MHLQKEPLNPYAGAPYPLKSSRKTGIAAKDTRAYPVLLNGVRRTYTGKIGSSSKTKSPSMLIHSPFLARSPHRIIPSPILDAEGPPVPPPRKMTEEEEKIALSAPDETLVLEHAFGYNRAPNNIHIAGNEIIYSSGSLAVIADMNTGTQRFFGEKGQHNGAEVTAVAFCGTKRLCATGQRAKTTKSTHPPCICVWKMEDTSLVHKLVGHRRTVSTLSFCEDGSLLVSQTDGEAASETLVWDMRAHSVSFHSVLLSLNEPMMGALFAPTGTTCAFYGKREVVFGNISLPSPKAHTKADFDRYSMSPKEHITARAWGAEKHVFLLGTNFGKVYSFPKKKISGKPRVVANGESIIFIAHLKEQGYMICTSEGSLISYDNEWNVFSRTPVVYPYTPQIPLKMVAACYSETDAGGILIVGTGDNEICKLGPNIFDIVKSRKQQVNVETLHKGPHTEMRAMAAHPIDTGGIAFGGPRGEITFYDTIRRRWFPTPSYVCSNTVCAMNWDPRGRLLAVGLENGTVEVLLSPSACSSTDSSFKSFTHSSAHTSTAEVERSVKTDDIFLMRDPPRFLRRFRCCSAQITDIQFEPMGGNTMVASSLDQTVVIFSVERKQRIGGVDDITQLFVLKDHASPVVYVQYSLGGKHVLALMKNSKMKCWDVSTGRQRVLLEADESWYGEDHQYRLPQGWPCAGISSSSPARVTCSSNFGATVLATGEESAEIKLYRFPSHCINGRKSSHHVYTGHTSKVHRLCWTIDGRLLTMGSGKNDCILQWRLDTNSIPLDLKISSPIIYNDESNPIPSCNIGSTSEHNIDPTSCEFYPVLNPTPSSSILSYDLLQVNPDEIRKPSSCRPSLTDSTLTIGAKSESSKTPTISTTQQVSLRHQKLLRSAIVQPKRTLSRVKKQKENDLKPKVKTLVLSERLPSKSTRHENHSTDYHHIASSDGDEKQSLEAPVEGTTLSGGTYSDIPASASKTDEASIGEVSLSDRSSQTAIHSPELIAEESVLSPREREIDDEMLPESSLQEPSRAEKQLLLLDDLDTEWERRKEQLAEEARRDAEKEIQNERKKLVEAKGMFDEEQRAWRLSLEEKEATVVRLQEKLRSVLEETEQKLNAQVKNGDVDALSTRLGQSQSQSHLLPQQVAAAGSSSQVATSPAVCQWTPVHDVGLGWRRPMPLPQKRIINCAPSPEPSPGGFAPPLPLSNIFRASTSPTVDGGRDISSPRREECFGENPEAVSRQYSSVSRQYSSVSRQYSAVSRQYSAVSRQYSAVSRQYSMSPPIIHRSLSPVMRKSSQGSFDCSPATQGNHVMPLSSRLPDSSSRVQAMMAPSVEVERVTHCSFRVSPGPTGSTTVVDSMIVGSGNGGGNTSKNSSEPSAVLEPVNHPMRMRSSTSTASERGLYSSSTGGVKEKEKDKEKQPAVRGRRVERFGANVAMSSNSALWGSPRDFRTSPPIRLNKLQFSSPLPEEQPLLNWCQTPPQPVSSLFPPQPRQLFSISSPILDVRRGPHTMIGIHENEHEHESEQHEGQPGEPQQPPEQQQQPKQHDDHNTAPCEQGVGAQHKLFELPNHARNMNIGIIPMLPLTGTTATSSGSGRGKMNMGTSATAVNIRFPYPQWNRGLITDNPSTTAGNGINAASSSTRAPFPAFSYGSSSPVAPPFDSGGVGIMGFNTVVYPPKNPVGGASSTALLPTYGIAGTPPAPLLQTPLPPSLSPSPSIHLQSPSPPIRLQSPLPPCPPTMIRQNSVISVPSWTMCPPISLHPGTTNDGGFSPGAVGAPCTSSGTVFGGAFLALHKPQSMPRLTPEITFSMTSANSNDVLISATLDSIVDTRKTKADAIELPLGWGMFRTRGGMIIWMKITSEKSRAYEMFKDTIPFKLIFSAALLKNGTYQQAGVLHLMVHEVCEEATNVQAMKDCTDEGIFNLSLGGYIRVRNEEQMMDEAVKNWLL